MDPIEIAQPLRGEATPIRRILYAASPDSKASEGYRCAADLARRVGASLTVAAVAPVADPSIAVLERERAEALRAAIRREYALELESLAALDKVDDIKVRVELLEGRPFLALIRRVLDDDIDLLMKVAAEAPGLRSRIFGSTDLHLLRKCPCPVWLLHPSGDWFCRKVLVALDVGAGASLSFARTLLTMARGLAAEYGAELHVVHAWSLVGESSLRVYEGVERSRMRAWADATRAERAEALEGLLSEMHDGGSEIEVHLPKGDPTKVVPRLVRRLGIDLLVLGTVGRTGIPGLLIGNVAEGVLDQVDCSVVALKPEGFRSPVAGDER